MIVVSDKVKELLASDTREIMPRVHIYFDGEDKDPRVFTHEDIVSLSILEETAAQGDLPLGSVCSSELSLSLYNQEQEFTLTNINSPLAGKLLPGVKCIVEALIFDEDELVQVIPMGTFYLEDYPASTGSLVVDLVGYDRLYQLFQMPSPLLPLYRNISLQRLFTLFFTSLGLTEGKDFVVSSRLSRVAPWAWVRGATVQECLKDLCASCTCLVFVNKHGRIEVLDQLETELCDYVLDEDKHLYQIDNVPNYTDMFTSVNMTYTIPGIANESSQILLLDELSLSPGRNTFPYIKYNTSPVGYITGVQLTGGNSITIEKVQGFTEGMSLEVNNNAGTTQTVQLIVFGQLLQTSLVTLTKTNDGLDTLLGTRTLQLSSHLVQDNNTAQEFAQLVLTMYSNFGNRLKLSLRGNPLLELSDTFRVRADSQNINSQVIPLRMEHTFDSGYSLNIDCILASSRKFVETIFISPGLVIEATRD